MEDKKIHIIEDLLCKLWAGTITPAERTLLDEMAGEDSLKHLREELESDRYVMGRFKEYSKYDTHGDFNLFLKMVEKQKVVKHATKRIWIRWSYAVSIVLSIVAFIFFYQSEEKGLGEMDIASQVAKEAEHSKMSRLILSDMEVVTLDKMDGTMVLDSLGVVVAKGPRVLDYTRVKRDVKDSVAYHTLIVPKGCLYKVVLNDGTKVTLNANSRMKYPMVFSSGKREVYLDGEAFFEVTKNENAPFWVSGKNFGVRVLGTTFNVMNYDDEVMSSVTLLSGSVEMNMKDTTVRMEPGEQIEVRQNEFIGKREVDPSPYISWMEDKFCFENERLEVILRKLGRWYDVSIWYDTLTAKDTRFSGYIPNDIGLKDVLELLQETTDIEFFLQDSVVSVKDLRIKNK